LFKKARDVLNPVGKKKFPVTLLQYALDLINILFPKSPASPARTLLQTKRN